MVTAPRIRRRCKVAEAGPRHPHAVPLGHDTLSSLTAVAHYFGKTVDTDTDGLPDWWEVACFGNTDALPGGDPDQDQYTNLQEYQAGTDPTNAASVLYHITITADGGTVVISPNQSGYASGQVVTLTASVTNFGPSSAPSVSISAFLPEGFTFVKSVATRVNGFAVFGYDAVEA